MRNREEGTTYQRSPMGGTPKPVYMNAVQQDIRPLPTASENMLGKLMEAYNSKALANPLAPLLERYSYGGSMLPGEDPTKHDILNLMTQGGDRLGFIGRDTNDNGVTLKAALDNMGSPDRGAYDGELNTGLGTLGYGYDGDTVYGNFSPNVSYLMALKNLLGR